MNALLYFFLFLGLLVNHLAGTLVWIVTLPANFWRYHRRSFKEYLTEMPQVFREKIRMYDAYNLRHNLHYLRRIKTDEMALWPIERQAEFADLVTVNLVKAGTGVDFVFALEQLNPKTLNATGIGNLAYLALYLDKPEDRQQAAAILQKVRAYFTAYQN